MSEKRLWLKVLDDGKGGPIAFFANGKVVLFNRRRLPPIGRMVDTIIEREEKNKAIGLWTGAMKPS